MQKRVDDLSFCVTSRIRRRRRRSSIERHTKSGCKTGGNGFMVQREHRLVVVYFQQRAPSTCDGFIAVRGIIRSSKEAMTAVASCHGFSFRCTERRSPEPCSMEHISQRHSADAPNSCTRHIDASALKINIHTLLCVIDTVALE